MQLPSLPFRLTRPAPDARVAEALLRLLDESDVAWDTLAEHAMRDAALTFALLWMAPLQADEPASLKAALAHRLERAGHALLRAWLMHAGSQHQPADAIHHANAHAVLVAEAAMHLAIEKHYPRPEEAYLAGLWQSIGVLSLIASTPDYLPLRHQHAGRELLNAEQQRFGTDHIQLAARLAAHCCLPAVVADAVALGHALEEHIAAAHPLAAILRSAVCLCDAPARIDEAARLTGLNSDSLSSLKTDVGYLSAQGLQTLGIGLPAQTSADNRQGSYPVLPASWRTLTLAGLLAGVFEQGDEAALSQRLADTFRLLFGKTPPLMLLATDNKLGQLLAHAPAISTTALDELGLNIDDETSVVALAVRTQSSTSHFPGQNGPGRSTRDWHLTRWLNAAGILCLPWHTDSYRGVAVLGIDESLDITPDEQQLMGKLVGLAAHALTRRKQQQIEMQALTESVQAAHVEKARRITHEINNPLTVIKSYLGIIGQRDSADMALAGELSQVSKEIDRVSALLRRLTDPTAGQDELAAASLTEVVGELQRIYGEALFTQQRRELEVRIPGGLPRVAMPASALKQIVLNLMRNAAEALPEGSRLSISSPGVLIADGTPSLELRLVDNGPGIAESRLRHLFDPAPSTKGEAHQGIGLSIVKDILSQWGAYILCRSQKDHGTSFQLFIPLEDSD